MMLKSVNIPESIGLFILTLWITIDLWTRPLSFTDEVLPNHWNVLITLVYLVLFIVFYLVTRPIYFPPRAWTQRLVTLFLLYVTFHTIMFLFRPATASSLSLLHLFTTWLFVIIVLSLTARPFVRWFQLLNLILLYQALCLAAYALLVSFGQEYVPIDNIQLLRLGPISLSQLYVGEQGGFLRSASLTNNPNAFAAWLVPGGLIAWMYVLQAIARRSLRSLVFFGLVLSLIFIGLLLSASQTGIYSFCLLALLTTLLLIPEKRLRYKVTGLYLLGAGILIGSISFNNALFAQLISLNGRSALWQAGLSASTDRLWFGHGLGSSVVGLEQQLGPSTLYTFHSTPIVYLYEFGLIGLLLYLASFLLILVRFIRDYRHDDSLSVILLLLSLWLLLLQFTESVLIRPSGFYFIWLSFLIYATRRRTTSQESTHT
ncbi:O-antigen ligase family protein [Exiguobacterium antarcticum]|uniref:O-antigen ligase family protein n=1 Tax=Exiguobacterium antarcticum TaxID=132920 RepID=A0ABT6R4F9_9BACL|nr:O-antigen ligase family protein [Exiguobacterium antarcticum]MDI3235837.1 O-antigen ligase family protein [Exiguobacterium antarcticum]